MKKQILNLGKALNKAEQKTINGGGPGGCYTHQECPAGHGCCKGEPDPDGSIEGVCIPSGAWCEGGM